MDVDVLKDVIVRAALVAAIAVAAFALLTWAFPGIQFGAPDERRPRRDRSDRGQVTAFIVVFAAALIMAAGLVIDGGRSLAARSRATEEAQEAARAGAQHLDLVAYRETGRTVLDAGAAQSAVLSYLAATGDRGQVAVSSGHIHVTVTVDEPMRILSAIGLHDLTVSGSADVDAEQAVVGAGP